MMIRQMRRLLVVLSVGLSACAAAPLPSSDMLASADDSIPVAVMSTLGRRQPSISGARSAPSGPSARGGSC